MRALQHFNAFDVNPAVFVNREAERERLQSLIEAWLGERGVVEGCAVCVVGDKGAGKSILTRAVLNRVQMNRQFVTNTLVLTVDCRRERTRRAVFTRLAQEALDALDKLRSNTVEVPRELLEMCKVLRTLSMMAPSSKLQSVYEHLDLFKGAAGFKGSVLLATLALDFNITLETSRKAQQTFTGEVTFDDEWMLHAVVAFFKDLLKGGFRVVVYVDNVDELRHHDYRDEAARRLTRSDAEALLGLKDAPVALVLNMRTYYVGMLRREIEQVRLSKLKPESLVEILERRLWSEREELRGPAMSEGERQAVTELARMARTPLAFLQWYKDLHALNALALERLDEGFRQMTETSNVVPEDLQSLGALYNPPGRPVPREKVLAALGGNEAVLQQLMDQEILLPQDFWNPVAFTLDPEFDYLHRLSRAA